MRHQIGLVMRLSQSLVAGLVAEVCLVATTHAREIVTKYETLLTPWWLGATAENASLSARWKEALHVLTLVLSLATLPPAPPAPM